MSRPITSKKAQQEIIKKLINKYKSEGESMRALCREIGCDITAMVGWRDGTRGISAEWAIQIFRLFNIQPHSIRPDIFPADLEMRFSDEKKK